MSNEDYITVVFKKNARTLDENPFKIQSEFGTVVGVSIGDLMAEIERLRAAVSWLANLDMDRFTEHDEALLETAIEEARAALGGENG